MLHVILIHVFGPLCHYMSSKLQTHCCNVLSPIPSRSFVFESFNRLFLKGHCKCCVFDKSRAKFLMKTCASERSKKTEHWIAFVCICRQIRSSYDVVNSTAYVCENCEALHNTDLKLIPNKNNHNSMPCTVYIVQYPRSPSSSKLPRIDHYHIVSPKQFSQRSSLDTITADKQNSWSSSAVIK